MNCCQFCTNKETDKREILCEMQSTRNVLEGDGRERSRKTPTEIFFKAAYNINDTKLVKLYPFRVAQQIWM